MTEHCALALAVIAMADTLAYLSHGPMSPEQKADAVRKLGAALTEARPHFNPADWRVAVLK
jgi:hypothetical protein